MAKESDHGKAIAKAAAQVLIPLGYARRGQSRLWIADQGFWIAVVEFQPSGYAKGSYVNVCASWLWALRDPYYIAFEYFDRLAPYADLGHAPPSEEALQPLTIALVPAIERLYDTFSSFPAIDAYLEERASEPRASLHDHYNAAVSAGLGGDSARRHRHFGWIAAHEARADWEAALKAKVAHLAEQAATQHALSVAICREIERARTQLRLAPSAYPPAEAQRSSRSWSD